MKYLIAFLAVVLVAVQVVQVLGLVEWAPFLVALITVGLGVAILVLSIRLKTTPDTAANTPKPTAPTPARGPAPVAPKSDPVRAEAEIVAFLALLQSEGRLVDFAQELIDDASDEQVGAAARVVHAGVRKVLREYVEMGTVRPEQEGTEVVLKSGFDPALYRLLGTVSDHPPYKGRILHPGWAVKKIKLPEVTSTVRDYPWPVLAPAEIEVQGD